MSEGTSSLSVIIPAYNEMESLPILVERLVQTFGNNHLKGEIIIVDDGSTDGTRELSAEISTRHRNVRVIRHKRNMGKTEALYTGFENSSGDVIVIIDADLQYSPEDLPKLLAKIEQGYDVVNGWRKHRHDSIIKKIPSSVYNFISSIFFGIKLHDFNSGFKALKRDILGDLNYRKGQHRFFLNIAHYKGYRVGEVEIQHFPRKLGRTKYGSSRMFWGFFDLIGLRLQLAFTDRPMALFGLSGVILLSLGFITGAYLLALRLLFNEPFDRHIAMMLLTFLLIMAGIQTFLFGFVADMIANLRSELKKKK